MRQQLRHQNRRARPGRGQHLAHQVRRDHQRHLDQQHQVRLDHQVRRLEAARQPAHPAVRTPLVANREQPEAAP